MGNAIYSKICEKCSKLFTINLNPNLNQNNKNNKKNKHKQNLLENKYSLQENLLTDFQNSQTFSLGKSTNKSQLKTECNESTNPESIYNIDKKRSNFGDFEILKLLGQGSFGKVFLVKHKIDKKLFAMKVLNKEKIFKSKQVIQTKNEREILEKLDNPFIVKLYFAFQSKSKLYLVTEFVQGGELFQQIKLNVKFNENVARFYTSEIIIAIEFMHKKGIIYRDLKPENILIDINGHIKITDFGLSKMFENNSNSNSNDNNKYLYLNKSNNSEVKNTENNFELNKEKEKEIKFQESVKKKPTKTYTICGTPEYLAPEILTKEGYDKSVDWYSLGILILEMLIGKKAFKQIFKLVNQNKFKKLGGAIFTQNENEINSYGKINFGQFGISKEAENLIKSLLEENPNFRLGYGNLDSQSIKSHPFFAGINWDFVYQRKYKPDFIPNLSDEFDLKYFDNCFTSQKINNFEESENLIIFRNNKFVKATDYSNNIPESKKDFANFSFRRDSIEL